MPDENPYGPLSQFIDHDDEGRRKPVPRGRGRNRKQNNVTKPGPIPAQPPATNVKGNGRRTNRDTSPVGRVGDGNKETQSCEGSQVHQKDSDISTSWYEEEDESTEETVNLIGDTRDGSDDAAGGEVIPDDSDQSYGEDYCAGMEYTFDTGDNGEIPQATPVNPRQQESNNGGCRIRLWTQKPRSDTNDDDDDNMSE